MPASHCRVADFDRENRVGLSVAVRFGLGPLLLSDDSHGVADDVFDHIIRSVVGPGHLSLVAFRLEVEATRFGLPLIRKFLDLELCGDLRHWSPNLACLPAECNKIGFGESEFIFEEPFVEASKMPDLKSLVVYIN